MTATRKYRVALIGTESLPGKELKSLLSVKRFPLAGIEFFDPDVEEEYSKLTEFRDEPKVIHHLEARRPGGLDLVFLAADEETSRTYGRLAAEWRSRPSILSGAFNEEAGVPARGRRGQRRLHRLGASPLVANPHPATIILSPMLHRLLREFGVAKAVAFVLQPASAFDDPGIQELASQSVALLSAADPPEKGLQGADRLQHPVPYRGAGCERLLLRRAAGRGRDPAGPGQPGLPAVPVLHPGPRLPHLFDHDLRGARPAAQISSPRSLFRESPVFQDRLPLAAGVPAPRSRSRARTRSSSARSRKTRRGPALWIWLVADNLTRGSALNALEIAEKLLGAPNALPLDHERRCFSSSEAGLAGEEVSLPVLRLHALRGALHLPFRRPRPADHRRHASRSATPEALPQKHRMMDLSSGCPHVGQDDP